MGLFDKILGSSDGSIKKPPFIDDDGGFPVGRLTTEHSKEDKNKNRKEIEEHADKINPAYGKVIKAMNNLGDTLDNAQDSLENGIIRKLFSPEVNELNIADHLFVQRIGYTHHGLYVGNGKVIHYLANCVGEGSLETFANGAKIHKKTNEESPICYSKEEVISRAYRRLNEDKYNLLINNCENYVRWCRTGTEYY